MPFIEGDVAVREVDDKNWKLIEEIVYEGYKETFRVPAGFLTDFASIPRIFVWLLPRYGRYTKAAILHDYLCKEAKKGHLERADADGLFRRVMAELGVAFVRRWVMWAGVRAGSGARILQPGLRQFLIFLLVALPTVVYVVVPALVILLALLVFWVVELLFFVGLKPFSKRKPVNQPKLLLKLS